MGNYLQYMGVKLSDWPEDTPKPLSKPTFDPHFGFDAPRKKREMKLTVQEMDAMKFRPDQRDYCAHLLAKLMDCKFQKAPLYFLCKHQAHAWEDCRKEDFFLRMKEYEREKRLRLRKMKLEGKALS